MNERGSQTHGETDPEMLADIEEAKSFMRSQGLMYPEERLALVSEILNPEEKERLERLSIRLNMLDTALLRTPEMQMLQGRVQLAGRGNPDTYGDSVQLRPFHNRLEHSQVLSILGRVAAIKAGLEDDEVLALAASALLHDVGHCAYGHVGDEFYKKKGGLPHEERSVNIVKEKMTDALDEVGVDSSKVIEAIREKGVVGSLQSTLDTLAYLILDSAMLQDSRYEDHGHSLLQSIKGIDRITNHVIVSDIAPWQELLEARARYMQEIIYHPDNKRVDEAITQLLRIAIEKGYLAEDELLTASDQGLQMRFQSLVQPDTNAALMGGRHDTEPQLSEYKDLYQCAQGILPEGWSRKVFDTEGKANEYVASLPESAIERSIIVRPL